MAIFSSTITDLASNKMAQPYYKTNGTTSDRIIANEEDKLDFAGSRQVSMSALVRWNSQGTGGDFINLGWAVRMRVATTVGWIIDWGDGGDSGMVNTGVTPVAGELAYWVFTFDGASSATEGTAIVYKNGVIVSNLTSTNYYHTLTDASRIGINSGPAGGVSYGGNDGEVFKAQVWNKTLTATEVEELYNGASVPYKYKGASGTEMYTKANAMGDKGGNEANATTGLSNRNSAGTFESSGTSNVGDNSIHIVSTYGNAGFSGPNQVTNLVIGKRYRVSYDIKVVSGSITSELFTGSSGNHVSPSYHNTADWTSKSFEFIAEGTALGFYQFGVAEWYTDNFSVTQIGAVAEYDGSGIAQSQWLDKSGNDLHGTVTGATVENAPAGAPSGLVYEEGTIENPMTIGGTTVVTYEDDVGGMGWNDFQCKYRRIGDVVHCWYVIDTGGQNMRQWKDGSGNAVGTGSNGTADIQFRLPIAANNYNYVQNAQQMFYHGTSVLIYTYVGPYTEFVSLYTDLGQVAPITATNGDGGSDRIVFRHYFCYYANLT